MFRKYVHKHISWYDFKSTNLKEFLDVSIPHTIPGELIKKLLSRSKRSGFIELPEATYISLTLPTSNEHSSVDLVNIKMIFGEHYLVTNRDKSVPGFKSAKKRLNPSSSLQGTTPEILLILFTEIFRTIETTVSHQSALLERARKQILNGQYISKQYIHGLNSSVLKVYSSLDSQVDVFHSLRKEEDILTKDLEHILGIFDATLLEARTNVEHIVDQKLLFKQALMRQKKLDSLRWITFIVVFCALLFVGLTAFSS